MNKDEFIDIMDDLVGWIFSTPKERQAKVTKAVVLSYLQTGFAMVTITVCVPVGEQAMLCNQPPHEERIVTLVTLTATTDRPLLNGSVT